MSGLDTLGLAMGLLCSAGKRSRLWNPSGMFLCISSNGRVCSVYDLCVKGEEDRECRVVV